jgi:hypothetical protein
VTELGETETATLAVLPTVTVAVPNCEASAKENAVTVTVDGEGAVEGAVNKPLEVMEPQVMPLQPAPMRLQETRPSGAPAAVN